MYVTSLIFKVNSNCGNGEGLISVQNFVTKQNKNVTLRIDVGFLGKKIIKSLNF